MREKARYYIYPQIVDLGVPRSSRGGGTNTPEILGWRGVDETSRIDFGRMEFP